MRRSSSFAVAILVIASCCHVLEASRSLQDATVDQTLAITIPYDPNFGIGTPSMKLSEAPLARTATGERRIFFSIPTTVSYVAYINSYHILVTKTSLNASISITILKTPQTIYTNTPTPQASNQKASISPITATIRCSSLGRQEHLNCPTPPHLLLPTSRNPSLQASNLAVRLASTTILSLQTQPAKSKAMVPPTVIMAMEMVLTL